MRSPGTAPPGSKVTGRSSLTPRMARPPLPPPVLAPLSAAELQAHDPVDVEPAVLPAGATEAARAAVGRLLRLLDRLGNDGAEDVVDRQLVAADGGKHVVERFVPRRGSAFFSLSSVSSSPRRSKCEAMQAPAELGVLLAHGIARGAADGRARACR